MIKIEDIESLNYSKLDILELKSGTKHYKLLAYLSTLFNNTHIIDIGTHKGGSSKALSYNESNTVYTFDIVDNFIHFPNNVIFNLFNLFNDQNEFCSEIWREKILSAPLIFLDIDPHDGEIEYNFYLFLKENNYQGILILDDIWYFKKMRDNCWFKILTEDKLDITNLGHWSGTGVIQFKKENKLNFETYASMEINNVATAPGAPTTPTTPTTPTLVTAYFDLTKMSDASTEINNRPKEHYLSNAYATLNLDYDMIIYCEDDNLDIIKQIRPSRLHPRTKFIVQNFDDFEFEGKKFSEYRNIINNNRITNPYHFDNRNTASYYLFCISRYLMLLQTMSENIFNSEHFVWINICIERMGFKNLVHLDEALSNIRDKFSTCYIDYISDKLIQDASKYFEYGRCSMCSGFFTGNKMYMGLFCNAVLNKFIEYVNMGYGHADEQLFSPVYFENPEFFEFYYGDYNQMVTNYRYCYENPNITTKLLIPKSYNDKKFSISLNACRFLFNSLQKNNDIILDKNFYNLYMFSILMEDLTTDSIIEINKIKSIICGIKIAFYTCYIGNNIKNIPLPSTLYDCYYYTNNVELIENSGWIPVKVNIPISTDYNTNTMDCKVFKTSPHLFKELQKYDYVCWIDNNLKINIEKIINLVSRMKNENKLIILSKHPYQFSDVWGEFNEAMKYEMYLIDKYKYKSYIEKKIDELGTDKLNIHYCAGFSICKMKETKVIQYNEEWQKNIKECGIEDQISLQFIQQNYTDIIMPIEYKECWDYI
jgi:hypothetical protein